ncbi:transcription initiation factor TFIID subunit 6 [Fusarium austroafricanum]|uniref:TBP-associated factor 6 n=1 Tax=Fusarium austroafricanum TaxID=2364996 RepID=A0A8H4KKJ8_9HYPO|nr:transcription initiation factor TFIID subunit 6 [Fusarium austroafricanum]
MTPPKLPTQTEANDKRQVLVGLDFGTTYSGISYAKFDSHGQIHAHACRVFHSRLHGHVGGKVPTKIQNEQTQGLSLEWFKLSLLHRDDLPADVRTSPKFNMLTTARESVDMSAIAATGAYLRMLWDPFYRALGEDESNTLVQLTVTVPVVWPQYARQSMLQAIQEAGIVGPRVQLAPKFVAETEATAITLFSRFFNRQSSNLKEGDLVIVCDCGGGTVDSIAYEIVSLEPFFVKECIPGECILAGGTLIDDDGFMHLLRAKARSICSDRAFATLTDRDFEDFARHRWEYDMKLRYTVNAEDWDFPLPLAWAKSRTRRIRVGTGARISFSASELAPVFEPVVTKIVKLVTSQMQKVQDATCRDVSHVVVAGGFGRNRYLQTRIEQAVETLSPFTMTHCYLGDEGWNSVSIGAVLHAIQAHSLKNVVGVCSRIARASYGVRAGQESVQWLINMGDSLATRGPNRRAVPIQALTRVPTGEGYNFTVTLCRERSKGLVEDGICRIIWSVGKLEYEMLSTVQGGLEIEFHWDGNSMDFSLVYRGVEQETSKRHLVLIFPTSPRNNAPACAPSTSVMASDTPKLLWNPDNVKDVAESVGISSLNEEALKCLSQDVEYRIGQVIVESLRFMRAARRTTLTVNDISLALKALDVEPLYGYDSTRPLRYGEASLGPGQPLFYIEDEEVDFEKLINAPLPKVPRDMGFTAHWLAIEGVQPSIPQNPTTSESRSQELLPKGPGANPALSALAGNDNVSMKPSVKHIVSKELILYFDKIQAAVLDDNPDEEVVRLRQAALGSVRDDPGLHQLIPYFITFIMDRVTHHLDDTFTLKQMMELTNALIENKSLFLDPYASPLSAPALTCLMARKLGTDEGTDALKEQYDLRQLAASLVGQIARKYSASNTLLRPKLTRTCLKYFLDPTKPPAVLYGAIHGLLEAGGPEAIRVLVLRNLKTFDSGILQPLKEKAEGTMDYEMLVQGIVQAVASLADHIQADANEVNGTGSVETELSELKEFIGPIVGDKIASAGNRRLIRTILDARNLD